jgi:hypothetical protein
VKTVNTPENRRRQDKPAHIGMSIEEDQKAGLFRGNTVARHAPPVRMAAAHGGCFALGALKRVALSRQWVRKNQEPEARGARFRFWPFAVYSANSFQRVGRKRIVVPVAARASSGTSIST